MPHRFIRAATAADEPAILGVINAAAIAYRGAIPADRYHEPYMSAASLRAEIAAGVAFSVCGAGAIVGVMGAQPKANVDLIRHAYTLPAVQGQGIGTALLAELTRGATRPCLVGTWRAADWAIRFYQHHGFTLVAAADIAALLEAYWSIPERQTETSVVLASPPLQPGEAAQLIAAARQAR